MPHRTNLTMKMPSLTCDVIHTSHDLIHIIDLPFQCLFHRAKLKAVRLQAYWKKICEDEKRSQWRNEQLIKDFDRVEAQMAALSARSERLRTMKVSFCLYYLLVHALL